MKSINKLNFKDGLFQKRHTENQQSYLGLSIIFLLLIVFWGNISNVYAQDILKYKDVFEVITTQGDDKAYPLLKLHQQQDPYHVNTYYQLGVICQKWAKKYDPLTEYDNVKYFVYHANLYLTMASKYLDDKEARKNRDYYHLVPLSEGQKKIELVDIQKDINDRIADVEYFNKNITLIRKNYYSAVNSYNLCLEYFLELNKNNSKLKDIYLVADDKIIKRINNIQYLYDSALYYFDAYKKAITDFPIKDYHQEYTLQDIETYKLHGLTNSNFLMNAIEIWNYGDWVKAVLKIINDDITKLRNDIAITGKEIDNRLGVLNITKDYSDKYEGYELDKNLVYRIGKYDYKPLIIDLFNYQITKIDYLIKAKDPLNNPEDSAYVELQKRLKYLHSFVELKQLIDKKSAALQENTTDYNVLKYQSYIENNFNDKTGLSTFIEKEDKNNKEILDKSMQIVRNQVIDLRESDHNELEFAKYKNATIPLFETPVTILTSRPEQYYTNQIEVDADGNYYLSGFYKNTDNSTKAFIAKSDSNKNVLWLKNYDFSTKENPGLFNSSLLLELTEEGCVAIVHSNNNGVDSVYISNQLVRLDEKGKEIINQKVGPSLVPKYLFFDDLNEKMLIAYKGVKIVNGNRDLQETVIDFADSSGYTLWTTTMELEGNIVEVIRSNENFILIANFAGLVLDGKEYKVNGSDTGLKTNAFAAIIDETGSIKNVELYSSNKSFFVSNAVKLNSEVINLLGFETNVQDYNYVKNPDVKFIYKLIQTDGKEIYNY